MSITVHGDDLKLVHVDWDHILTEHGLHGCDATRFGWQRKSKWYGNENEIKSNVNTAFDEFRQASKRIGLITLDQNPQLRSVCDVNIGEQCGTDVEGRATNMIRLVMEVKISGDSCVVTAFPW